MNIESIDHIVLTVRDIEATCAFYTQVLGMKLVTFGAGRKALTFGTQKINLHEYGKEFEPKAAVPMPGSADLCFVTAEPIADVLAHLQGKGVEVLEGPVRRTGAVGPITSVYFRDPDGNLVEVSNYDSAHIRNETDADARAISDVTLAAFETLEISGHTEHFIVEALRAAGALAVSLVAEVDGRVVGHIAFSPVTMSDGSRGWYGLGPVSVLPAFQRQGIGKALIREGLSRLKAMQAEGCCLVGHPDYYRKFGFENVPGLVLEGVPPEVFFALSFSGRHPKGSVAFHDGFRADGRGAERSPGAPGGRVH